MRARCSKSSMHRLATIGETGSHYLLARAALVKLCTMIFMINSSLRKQYKIQIAILKIQNKYCYNCVMLSLVCLFECRYQYGNEIIMSS